MQTLTMLQYVKERRGAEASVVHADEGAEYDATVSLNLSDVKTLVAKPGHPGNGVPLSEVAGTKIDKAYAGSCTAGDITSISMYAKILKGRKVAVPTWIQYGSERVRAESKKRGYHDDLIAAGVEVIMEPGPSSAWLSWKRCMPTWNRWEKA